MGIVNVTPDSFSDGGAFLGAAAAAGRVERVVEEGAAIVDIGGESTRPGAAPVPVTEEIDRVMPAIERAVKLPVVVSVDTSRPEVIRAAIAAGCTSSTTCARSPCRAPSRRPRPGRLAFV